MKRLWKYVYIALTLVLLGGTALSAAPLLAAGETLRVTSTADAPDASPSDGRCAASDGTCTLRAALMHANAAEGPQTIELPAGVYTLTVANDDPANDQAVRDLDITSDVTLRGVGPGSAIVQAGPDRERGIDRVLEVHRGANARIENVLLQHGRADEAGGIRVSGTLTLVGSAVSANDSAASGGGITNNDNLTLIDSAVTGNTANEGGGITNFGVLRLESSAVNSNAAAQAGGISPFGAVTLINSTVSSNRATGDGGGIVLGVSATGLRMFNVTLARNVADSDNNLSGRGGGIRNDKPSGVTLRNTLIGENRDGTGDGDDCFGQLLTSQGYNLLANPLGCGVALVDGDIIGQDPHLGTLQGESPQTHGLNPGSPAIDARDPAGCVDDAGRLLTTDQRKAARPFGPRCDIGAFEVNSAFIPTPTPQPAPGERCFPETGFCISGRIRAYWEQNGGLPVFGYPTTAQQPERVEAGTFDVQHFQRHRLELHPENPRPYDVLLGRLGAEQIERMRVASLPEEPLAGCLRFAQTQHMVCDEFAEAWQRDGLEFDGQPGKSFNESLALFGLPVTDRMTITLSDGKPYQVQYFERARFEYHPENAAPYNVLFGLLDNEARAGTLPPRPQSLLPAALYFLYDSQIVRLERDGLTQVPVVDERSHGEITTFSASPDGSALAYVLKTASGYTLIRTDRAGANRTELFSYPELISAPRWSPDGTRIAVHAGELTQAAQGGTYIVPANSGQARFSLPDSKSPPRLAYLPESWSADGLRLLVSAVVKQSEGCAPMLFDPGFGSEQLSDPPSPDGQRDACGGAWAAQGRALYLSVVPQGSAFAAAGLWRADLQANGLTLLVPVQEGVRFNLFGPMQPRADRATSVFLAKSERLPQLGDTRSFLYAPYIIGPDGTQIRQRGTAAFELRDLLGWARDGSGFLLRGTFGDPIGRVKTIWVPLNGGAPYEINNAGSMVSWGT